MSILEKHQADRLLKQWAQWWAEEFNALGASAPKFYREMPQGDWQDKRESESTAEDAILERVDRVVSAMRRGSSTEQFAAGVIITHYRDRQHRHNWGQVDYAVKQFAVAFG